MNGNDGKKRNGEAATGRWGIEPRWSWHYKTLVGLRERLLQDRSEQLAQAATPVERFSLSMADAASDEFNQEIALSEVSLEGELLAEIEEALRRLQNHTYGTCELSGKQIERSRLRVVPWTRFSKAAAEQLEKEGAICRAQLGRLGSVRQT